MLTAVSACAEALGLHVGMALSDALAIRPTLDLHEANPASDAALLDRIAAWCERYTPIVVVDGTDGLFLDITGCAHLHGGEENLLGDMKARLAMQGFAHRCALAPTPGAAWALARHGASQMADTHNLEAMLAPLPVAALRLAPEAAALLKRLGLKRIGQISHAPRAAFTARAGQNAMLRLDQALGRAQEALSPRRPPPPLYALRKLAEPILTLDALMLVTQNLCEDLCAELDKNGMGARLLSLSAFGLDGRVRRVTLQLSRLERRPLAMLRLFKEKLEREAERFNAEFGFEAARLDAFEIAPWALQPIDFLPTETIYDIEAEARLVDRIAARLGAERIGKLSIRDAHAPERASAWKAEATFSATPPEDGVMRRPLTLFARAQPIDAIVTVPDGPPLRFRWRRVLRNVARAEGPERIAPNWLRAGDQRTRDYYRVEDDEGRRYWIYRDGFYGAAEAPRWLLHGLFT